MADLGNEGMDRMVVAAADRLAFLPVVRERLQKFRVGFRMEIVGLHKPTSLRARAMTSSPGMGCTLPLLISARRCSAYSAHAASFSGSGSSCSSKVRRSTSSATCSRGNCRVSATI